MKQLSLDIETTASWWPFSWHCCANKWKCDCPVRDFSPQPQGDEPSNLSGPALVRYRLGYKFRLNRGKHHTRQALAAMRS